MLPVCVEHKQPFTELLGSKYFPRTLLLNVLSNELIELFLDANLKVSPELLKSDSCLTFVFNFKYTEDISILEPQSDFFFCRVIGLVEWGMLLVFSFFLLEPGRLLLGVTWLFLLGLLGFDTLKGLILFLHKFWWILLIQNNGLVGKALSRLDLNLRQVWDDIVLWKAVRVNALPRVKFVGREPQLLLLAFSLLLGLSTVKFILVGLRELLMERIWSCMRLLIL